MPQIFQVLRCYKCLAFQVHQSKKSNKFECKLCGEKQSIKRQYGLGTAKDCRLHVQKLNGIRGEINELKEEKEVNSDDDVPTDYVDIKPNLDKQRQKKSKWSNFVDKSEETPDQESNETMYLDNTEVVLEIPKKRKFKNPALKSKAQCDVNHKSNSNNDSFKSRTVNSSCENKMPSIAKANAMSLSAGYNPNCFDNSGEANNEPKVMKSEINCKNKVLEKKFNPPVLNSTSKWAQYLEEQTECNDKNDDSLQDIDNNEEPQIDYVSHETTQYQSTEYKEKYEIDKDTSFRKDTLLESRFDSQTTRNEQKVGVIEMDGVMANNGSKWAQFVEKENLKDSYLSQDVQCKTEALFSLCTDDDLDDVLNF